MIELMGDDGQSSGIPRAVKDCVEEIRRSGAVNHSHRVLHLLIVHTNLGLLIEGLFRRSPNSVMLRQVQDAYDRGQPVSLSTFNDPHIPAVLLKKFFRDLPIPVFPDFTYSTIQGCPYPSNDQNNSSGHEANRACVDYIRTNVIPLVDKISPPALIVLSYVLRKFSSYHIYHSPAKPAADLLHEVSMRSSVNRMDAANLALCFTPNLVAGPNIMRDIQMCSIPGVSSTTMATPTILPSSSSAQQQNKTFLSQGGRKAPMTLGVLIQICIEQYYEIFEEMPDRTNVSGLPTHPSVAASTLPPSSSYGTTFTGTTAASRSGMSSPSGYGTPLERSIHSEFPPPPQHPQTTPARPTAASPSAYRTPLSVPSSSTPTSPISSLSFTTADDSDEDPDESVLVMSLGPSDPSTRGASSSTSHPSSPAPPSAWGSSNVGIGHPSSPLSAPRHKHHRKDSALSTQTAQSATGTSSTLSEAARYTSQGGTLRTARSIISIENGKAGGGPGSIKLGRAGLSVPTTGAGSSAGSTMQRRTSGAGVEAVGVTAAGFFSPVSPGGSVVQTRVSEESDLD